MRKSQWLFWCLSLSCLVAAAQQPERETVSLTRWRAGLDVSTPLLLQLDKFAYWNEAIVLEGLVQRSLLRSGRLWGHVYSGYFSGKNELENRKHQQKGWYLKPGISFSFIPDSRMNPYLESSGLLSFGNVSWDIVREDQIFGKTVQDFKQPYVGGGFALGFGFYPLRIGAYRLRLSSEMLIGGFDKFDEGYLPGAGRLENIIAARVNTSFRLHLLREW